MVQILKPTDLRLDAPQVEDVLQIQIDPELNLNAGAFRRSIRGILPAGIIAGSLLFLTIGSTVGYKLITDPTEESKDWLRQLGAKAKIVQQSADIFANTELIESVTVDHNLLIQVYGSPTDPNVRTLIAQIKTELTALFQTDGLKKDDSVRRVVIFMTDQPLATDNLGFNTKNTNGSSYIVLGSEADRATIKHELLHGLIQSDDSKKLPGIISEGLVYHHANPEEAHGKVKIDPQYLLGSFRGIFSKQGSIDYKGSDIAPLQHLTMGLFWDSLTRIDPGISNRLLRFKGTPAQSLSDIRQIILDATDPDKKEKVQVFLDTCRILEQPERENIFVYPSISPEQKPKLVTLFVDQNHHHLDQKLRGWYQSSINGTIISPRQNQAFDIVSGDDIEFSKVVLQDGFSFQIWIELPNKEMFTRTFLYHSQNGNFSEIPSTP